MEVIQWADKKGYTIRLAEEERLSLYTLLKICNREKVLPQENRHFRIEAEY